ncbi:EamA family transporter [Calidifontibacter terrae]
MVVAALWGVNFLAIHASLEQFPPFLLVTMRWVAIAIPTVLLVPRPQVPLRYLLGYGAGFGTLQFAFLYAAMAQGMPTGLASLVLQASAPFTVLLGAVFTGERLGGRRGAGVGVAVLGLAVVASAHTGGATWWPFLLTLFGALGWAFGNLASRQAHAPNPLHFSLWMSVVPVIPLGLLSLVAEGPHRIGSAFATSGHAVGAWVGLAYTVLLGAVAGSWLWTWLMARHPAGVVAPYSMLVPVVGMTTAGFALGEWPLPIEIVGGVIIVAGVLYASAQPVPAPRESGQEPTSLREPLKAT